MIKTPAKDYPNQFMVTYDPCVCNGYFPCFMCNGRGLVEITAIIPKEL